MMEYAFSLKINLLSLPPSLPREALPDTAIDCSDKSHDYAAIAL